MLPRIKLSLAKVKMLAGIKGIDILIDGEKRGSIQFGDAVEFEVEKGHHTIQTVLHGVATRKSKVLKIQVAEETEYAVTAKYSRIWGNIKLLLA